MKLGGVLEAWRWWIWSIAAAAPVIVVVFVLGSVERNGFEPPTLAEWVFMGGMLSAWVCSAAVGLALAVALILRRWSGRGAEAVVGMFLSGTSALLLAGALLLVYYG